MGWKCPECRTHVAGAQGHSCGGDGGEIADTPDVDAYDADPVYRPEVCTCPYVDHEPSVLIERNGEPDLWKCRGGATAWLLDHLEDFIDDGL